MIRHAGPADGTKQDGIGFRELVEPVVRHHLAGVLVGLTRPVVVRQIEVEAEAARGCVQDFQRFRHGFLADPVAGENRDGVGARHGRMSSGQRWNQE